MNNMMKTFSSRRLVVVSAIVLVAAFSAIQPAGASNCSKTSVGFSPLTELGAGLYKGKQGGLYPGGSNTRPSGHEQAGLAIAQSLKPLDSSGAPSANGKIVLLSIGMSNTTQEFSTFKPLAEADSMKSSFVAIVDGAQGGMSADRIVDLNTPTAQQFWSTVDQRLQQAGLTPAQVQAAWMKQAEPGPTAEFPEDALILKGHLAQIVRILKLRFPNIRLAYLSSRIYAGYASSALNPEPFAYQSGFAVKWLIEDQINGVADLNFDSNRGEVKSPWLSWGPYLWADGMKPRNDGLTYACSDFADDGTHPATPGAREKVAQMLLSFMKTDSTATIWFSTKAADLIPPSVQLISPNGAEKFQTGQVITALWSAVDNVDIQSQDILLSTDKGKTFPITLAKNLSGNLRSFDVALPAAISTKKARIRIVVRDPAGNEAHDDSDRNFKIRP